MCQNNKPRVVFNRTAHQNMWRELACTGSHDRMSTREIQEYYRQNGEYPVFICFACQAVADSYEAFAHCGLCPLQWPDDIICCIETYCACKQPLYYMWSISDSQQERKLLARKIAELPVRPDWPGEII